jgi:NTE family protein
MNREAAYKYGFVLSGGAARGVAHLGIMQALEEVGIFPDVISGTSAGAIAGVLRADGYTPFEILELLSDTRLLNFVRPANFTKGFLSLGGMENVLKECLTSRTFEELKIPLYVCATNFNSGEPEYFHEGELVQRILASASIPVMFTPTLINKQVYVDGGITDNLPVAPLQDKCTYLLGMHVNPVGVENSVSSIMRIAERSFYLAMSANVNQKIPLFDLFIEPPEMKKVGLMDVSRSRDIFEIGYRWTRELLKGQNPMTIPKAG